MTVSKLKTIQREVIHIVKIFEFRKANRLTQAELGELIGVSQVAISTYENGERTPPLDVLIKLADVFDCTIDDLVDRTSTG